MYHFHRTRHLPRHPVLLLHRHSGGEGARGVRRQGAGDIGQSRLRAGVSRADEHAGMDADLPAVAVAVCDLHQRCWRAALGLIWIVGRILYMTGYSQAAEKRGPGFGFRPRLPPFSGWVRSAPSSGDLFMDEKSYHTSLRERSDEAIQSCRGSELLRAACHRARVRATRWLAMTRTTSSAGSLNPWRTGMPCRRARPRAACSSPRASWTPTAS